MGSKVSLYAEILARLRRLHFGAEIGPPFITSCPLHPPCTIYHHLPLLTFACPRESSPYNPSPSTENRQTHRRPPTSIYPSSPRVSGLPASTNARSRVNPQKSRRITANHPYLPFPSPPRHKHPSYNGNPHSQPPSNARRHGYRRHHRRSLGPRRQDRQASRGEAHAQGGGAVEVGCLKVEGDEVGQGVEFAGGFEVCVGGDVCM